MSDEPKDPEPGKTPEPGPQPEGQPADQPQAPGPQPEAKPETQPAAQAPPADNYAVQRLTQLVRAAKETAKAQAKFLRSQQRTKELKKDYESALEKEHRLVLTSEQRAFKLGESPDATDEGDDDEHEDDHKPAPDGPTPEGGEAAAPAPSRIPAPPEADDSWKAVVLSALGKPDGVTPLKSSTLTFLAEADVLTVGDVYNWTAPKPHGKEKRLTDIPGIGPGRAESIEEFLIEFWASRASNEGPADPPQTEAS